MDRYYKYLIFCCLLSLVIAFLWREKSFYGTAFKVHASIDRTPSGQKASSEKGKSLNLMEVQMSEIEKTASCYQTQNCDFDQSDPKAYDLAVGRHLASQIRALKNMFEGSSDRSVLFAVGRRFFINEDIFVKEAALEILFEQPQGENQLEALTAGIEGSYHSDLVGKVLPELQKYLDGPNEDRVHESLAQLIKGPHFTAQEVTKNILNFINPRSYDLYVRLAAQLPKQTQSYKNLKSALDEFAKRQQGG